ncbi:calcium channel protein, partial [Mortierella sp. AD010]
MEELSSQPSTRARSVTSRSSTSSTRERPFVIPESPTLSSIASKRSSIVQNRSSISGPPGTEHSGGWIAGLSDVMVNVSSRVVNTRAQEQLPTHPSTSSQGDPIESELNENHRPNNRDSFHQDALASSDALAWASGSIHGQGSERGSARIGRSTSKRSSSTNAGGTNLGVRTSQLGQNGHIQGTDISRTGTGSHLGKSGSAILEKAQQGDEESVFAPGGFVHRGDKMRLEGRSLKLFSPENPLRLWLASIIMSKYTDPFILVIILMQWVFFVITPATPDIKSTFGSYWTHYGLLVINILYTLEIIAKSIVYGLFFDRNGFQWRKMIPKSIQKFFTSTFSTKTTTSVKVSHSLSRVNSVSTNEKHHTQITTQDTHEAPEMPITDTDIKPAHAPFFRSYYNRLDAVVVVCYWVDFTLMMTGVQGLYIFKAISSLRPLRLLSLTEGTSTIIDSLSMSAPVLLTILGFIFFFFLILSLIGLLLFQGALSRRCAIQQDGDPVDWVPVSPETLCGGYYSDGKILGIVGYIGQGDGDDSSPRYSANICPEGQFCVQFKDYNPTSNLISFDNIFYSLLTVFTVSSMEGWTDVEYWVMDGDSKYAAIYFCASIFLMSFLMIPLFIAGITYSFGAVRAEKMHSAFTNKTRKTRILLDTGEGWQFEDQVHRSHSEFRQWLIRIVNDPWFAKGGAFMRAVIGSATGMLNLLLITFMFLLVCSPAPMMLFGGEMNFGDDQPVNFDDLGQNILLNLFVAIVLENFELDDDEKYKKQLEIYFLTHQRSKTDTSKSVF